MRRTLSERVERPAVAGRAWLLAGALSALGIAAPVAAQQDTMSDSAETVAAEPIDSVVAAAVSVSDGGASLELGLSDGRTVDLELAGGVVRADGQTLGRYEDGDVLDRTWRALLEEAAMATTAELAGVLRAWDPPVGAGATGRRLDERLEQALAGVGGRMPARVTAASPEDSIEQLLARIEELEDRRVEREPWQEPQRSAADEFVHDVAHGVGGFVATLVWIGVLFGLGAGLLFFGNGRLERIATTSREEPVRSGLIGLAGAFLAIPFYVLVIIALAISILGIPLILAWAPLFPMLFVISGLVGWLSVAYGAGDALAAGKLSTKPWFQDAGVFKRLLVGVGLLLSPFLVASMFEITSVLEWVGDILFAIGIIGNMLVVAVGFGAVLVRGRDALDRQRERRAAARRARLEAQTPATEGTNV